MDYLLGTDVIKLDDSVYIYIETFLLLFIKGSRMLSSCFSPADTAVTQLQVP